MGPLGFGGSASRGIVAQNFTGATFIVQIGMAFGVNRDVQRIGDVIVSTEIIPHDSRKVTSDPDGAQPYLVDHSGAGRFAAKESMITMFRAESESAQRDFQVFFGALLSGGARIFSEAFRNQLVIGSPAGDEDIIGGEMEGVGLLSVSPADEPLWIVVKGIWDFADELRDSEIDVTRSVACGNAARFVLSALSGTRSQAATEMEADNVGVGELLRGKG